MTSSFLPSICSQIEFFVEQIVRNQQHSPPKLLRPQRKLLDLLDHQVENKDNEIPYSLMERTAEGRPSFGRGNNQSTPAETLAQ